VRRHSLFTVESAGNYQQSADSSSWRDSVALAGSSINLENAFDSKHNAAGKSADSN